MLADAVAQVDITVTESVSLYPLAALLHVHPLLDYRTLQPKRVFSLMLSNNAICRMN